MSRQGTLQNRPSAGPILAALLACLLFMPVNAAAAEQVGRVLVAVGSVTAEQEDASARALGRRDPIYAGDRIRTAARGRVQIRFEDGAMVDLDPSSTFQVEEYASEDEDGGGSAVMSFLQGAMRTITGAIGGSRDDTYQMNTTVATIGVRGTAYALEYCDAECAQDGGSEGLYGRVDDGEVEVDGPGGTGGFSKGQYFFVPDGGAPERIVAPPDGVLEGEGETGAGGDDEQIEDVSIRPLDTGEEDGIGLGGGDTDLLDPDFESGENLDLEPEPEPEPLPGTTIEAAFSGAFLGSSGFAVYESPAGGDVRIDDEGRIVGAEFEGFGFVDATDLEHTGGLTTLNAGQESEFNVSWGSWSSDSLPEEDGTLDGFLYAITDLDNMTTAAEIDALEANFTFSVSYTDFGGPSVIGSEGGNWAVNNIRFDATFSAGAIDAASISLLETTTEEIISVDAGIEAPAIGTINPDGSFAADGLGDTDGVFSGEFEGHFLGTNAEGALMAFEIREIDGERRIVGTRILDMLEPG